MNVQWQHPLTRGILPRPLPQVWGRGGVAGLLQKQRETTNTTSPPYLGERSPSLRGG
jgi:hypothetical protein